ncbi:hypothetical protein [Pseudoalteromonas luteoviolacea]|uniref:hypothetical protein n=1 Tax=Pseudoalteromonas luteoviolacea TaxID=43657 RepID=UPI001B37C2CE|nr:hypothetical protein [Pseudoalteromonas luteoviolacea]MBQ4836020.1 hypothetical protein [Pseudoalteromonas luteoviolacea]
MHNKKDNKSKVLLENEKCKDSKKENPTNYELIKNGFVRCFFSWGVKHFFDVIVENAHIFLG